MPDSPLSPEVKVNLAGLDDPSQPFFSPRDAPVKITRLPWLKENTASFVALIVMFSGFAYLFWGPKTDKAAVVALMAAVVGYYFGSSPGSQKKDETIAQQLSKS